MADLLPATIRSTPTHRYSRQHFQTALGSDNRTRRHSSGWVLLRNRRVRIVLLNAYLRMCLAPGIAKYLLAHNNVLLLVDLEGAKCRSGRAGIVP